MRVLKKGKAVLQAFCGIQDKKNVLKTVYHAFKRGGVQEVIAAAKRAQMRGTQGVNPEIEVQIIPEVKKYDDTGLHILFVILVTGLWGDIAQTLDSILQLKNIDVEVAIITNRKHSKDAFKGGDSIRFYEKHWNECIIELLENSVADYVFFVDDGVIFTPNAGGAFFESVSLEKYDIIYCDECISEGEQKRYWIKPDFSKTDLLYRQSFGGAVAIARSFLLKATLDWANIEYPRDLFFTLALQVEKCRVKHIEKILALYQKEEAKANKHLQALVNSALAEDKIKARAILNTGKIEIVSGSLREKISIVLLIASLSEGLECIYSILNGTKYVDFELICVGESYICSKLREEFCNANQVIFAVTDKVEYAEKCNVGALKASGEIIVFALDNIRFKEKDWLYEIGKCFIFPWVGAVSPKIIRPENTIKYAGIISGGFGFTPIPFNGEENRLVENKNEPAFMNREISVLSATCMGIRKALFQHVGGFNEKDTPRKFSNAAMSFEIMHNGWSCVYCAESEILSHGEWFDSWYDEGDSKAYLYMLKKYGIQLSRDPFFTDAMKKQYLRGVPTDFRIYANGETNEQ